MLDLSKNIGGGDFRIVADLVSNDQRLGGAGEEVDADAREKLALGFGDESVARTDEDVDPFVTGRIFDRRKSTSVRKAKL